MDWLRDSLAPLFESKAGELLRDPWEARNQYIGVILDRSPEVREKFLGAQARRELSNPEKVTVLKLMELQRHAMLMYTSCGWFFDELSGIETVQVIQYAARAIQLAQGFSIPISVVINKYDVSADGTEKIAQFAGRAGVNLLGKIPYDPGVTKAMVQRRCVLENGESPASKAIRDIWDRMKNRIFS